jgi:hypothetical protein
VQLHDLISKPVVATLVVPAGPMALIRGRLESVQLIEEDLAHLHFDDSPRGTRVVLSSDGLSSIRRDAEQPDRLTINYGPGNGHVSFRDMSHDARVSFWRRSIHAARRHEDRQARYAALRLTEQMLTAEAAEAGALHDLLPGLHRALRQSQPWDDDSHPDDEFDVEGDR